MGRDLFTSPYGRFYHLALYLSELGHNVDLWLMSYRSGENEERRVGNLSIKSFNFWSAFSIGLPSLMRRASEKDPDWIIGFSDTYYGVLANHLAKKLGKRALIDAYDNYESYMPVAWPLHWLWRRSLSEADHITCAGPSLVDLLGTYCDKSRITILPMTADDNFYLNVATEATREELGLPRHGKLIGYHGSISHTRDIDLLFQAVRQVRKKNDNVQLVVSGRLGRGVTIPGDVRYIGYVDAGRIPLFLRALDLLVVTNKPGRFGNYSYPVKLYEAMVSGTPVVASRTPAIKWILRNHQELLVKPGSVMALAEKIEEVLALPGVDYQRQPTWKDLAVTLDNCMLKYR